MVDMLMILDRITTMTLILILMKIMMITSFSSTPSIFECMMIDLLPLFWDIIQPLFWDPKILKMVHGHWTMDMVNYYNYHMSVSVDNKLHSLHLNLTSL